MAVIVFMSLLLATTWCGLARSLASEEACSDVKTKDADIPIGIINLPSHPMPYPPKHPQSIKRQYMPSNHLPIPPLINHRYASLQILSSLNLPTYNTNRVLRLRRLVDEKRGLFLDFVFVFVSHTRG